MSTPEILLNLSKAKYLGKGNYNIVFRLDKEILKIPINLKDTSEQPHRVMRIWRELNDHPFETVNSIQLSPEELKSLGIDCKRTNSTDAWLAPYVEGRQSSDSEISRALIEIYRTTGRIVIDAPSKENFITTLSGQIVCVDVGMAIRLSNTHSNKTHEPDLSLRRQSSIESEKLWTPNFAKDCLSYHAQCNRAGYPISTQVIQALLFINQFRPDLIDLHFMLENSQLLNKLAQTYRDRIKNSTDRPEEIQKRYYRRQSALQCLDAAIEKHRAHTICEENEEKEPKPKRRRDENYTPATQLNHFGFIASFSRSQDGLSPQLPYAQKMTTENDNRKSCR